jgi:hypothetical protein
VSDTYRILEQNIFATAQDPEAGKLLEAYTASIPASGFSFFQDLQNS